MVLVTINSSVDGVMSVVNAGGAAMGVIVELRYATLPVVINITAFITRIKHGHASLQLSAFSKSTNQSVSASHGDIIP